tara:strand:- start:452 stop:1591 length:1140 start_codon:yes stop_codon:yes gene_type:complete
MTEKFRLPIEGNADSIQARSPFTQSQENMYMGVSQALEPSDEMALQALIEEQAIDDVSGFGGEVAEGISQGLSTALTVLKKGSRRTPVGLVLSAGTAGEGSDIVPDLTDINDPQRQDNLRNWGRGKESPKDYTMVTDSLDNPVVFFHSSPNFIGSTLDPYYAQLRDPGYFGEGVYLSSRLDESGKYLGKQHYFGKMPEDRKGGKYKEFHTAIKNPKIIPAYLRFEKALRLTAPKGEKGIESFVADEINAMEIKNGLMELLFRIKGVDPTKDNDTLAISKIKTNFGEGEDFNTPTKIRKYLSLIEAKNERGTELQLTQFLKSLGYDGILVLEDAERPNDYAEAVLFTKEQSKHATENVGTFLENPDLYTKAPKKDVEIPA